MITGAEMGGMHAATRQGMLTVIRSWERERTDASLDPPEGMWAALHPDLRLLASRTESP